MFTNFENILFFVLRVSSVISSKYPHDKRTLVSVLVVSFRVFLLHSREAV